MTGSQELEGVGCSFRANGRQICLPKCNSYEQALDDIRRKDKQVNENRHQLEKTTESLWSREKAAQETQSQCQALEESWSTIRKQVTQVWDTEELEHYHMVEAKRSKREACYVLLVAQLKAASGQVELRDANAKSGTDQTVMPM